jgi:hypothetical protein
MYVSGNVSNLTGKTWYYKACVWNPSNSAEYAGSTLSFDLKPSVLPAPTEFKIFKVESVKK